jgi:asparagine synthase (glutamine-hydrolysing)
MCGFVFVQDKTIDKLQVNQALNAIKHRGPDSSAVFSITNSVTIGHVRLSILGGDAGTQPLVSDSGALVYNGEIYNHKYIDARIHIQENNSDTLTLNHLCHSRQIHKYIDQIDGMFAFVYYSKDTGEWIAARDRFGIKPLYYAKTKDGGIAFASEVKALKTLAYSWKLNPENLGFFLSYQYYQPGQTLFDAIYEVEPGTIIEGSEGLIRNRKKYYQIPVNSEYIQASNAKDISEKYQHLLQSSVESHLLADPSQEITSFLSGGIDSSLISVLASRVKDIKHKAYHGYFAESSEYDESQFALATALESDIKLISVQIDQDKVVEALIPALSCLDCPLAGPGLIPQYIMASEVSKTSKVVLGGQGGDEIFGGYARYPIAILANYLVKAINNQDSMWDQVVDQFSSRLLGGLQSYMPMVKKLLRNENLYSDPDSAYELIINRSNDLPVEISTNLQEELNKAKITFMSRFQANTSPSYLDKILLTDIYGQLQALLQVDDRTTMASSLESRVPFLSNNIVHEWFSESIATRMIGVGFKAIPRMISKNYLPNAVYNRTDKMGFPVPFNHWLHSNKFVDQIKSLIAASTLIQQIAPNYQKQILESSFENTTYSRSLWGVITLAGWDVLTFQ